jgi:hypothetical protein
MRSALGASRSRLFRQTLTESVALSLVSAIVGAGFAHGIVTVFKAIGDRAIPRADDVQLGWPVVAFGLAASLVAAVVAGVLPALRAASPEHAHALKGVRSTTGRGERRLLASIATVQIVLTVALLTGAALLIRTSVKLATINPGYETDNILAATVTTVTPNSFLPFHTQVLERVAALPGGVCVGGAAHRQQVAGHDRVRRPARSRPGQPPAPVDHRRLFRVDGHADGRGPGVLQQRPQHRPARDDRQPVARQPLLLRRSARTPAAVRG